MNTKGDTVHISLGELTVRPLASADAPFLHKWLNDERVLEFYEGRDRPFSMDMIEAKFIKPRADREIIKCLVLWEDAPIGYIQVYALTGEERSLYGYPKTGSIYGIDQFIGEPLQWNRGIGTRLVQAIKDWLVQNAKADCVVLDPRVDNERAIHVYEKCGFKKVKRLPQRELHEGTYRDCWLMEAKLDGTSRINRLT